MVRPIRIEYIGALYHATSRDDRREDIFLATTFLGDDAFVDKEVRQVEGIAGEGDLREAPRTQRRLQAKPLNWFMRNYSSLDEGIVIAVATGDYLIKDIADEFNVHYSTVSRAIKKAEMHDCKT